MGGNEGRKPRVDPSLNEPEAPVTNQNTRVQCLKREVEQLYQNNISSFTATAPSLNNSSASNGHNVAKKFETEVFEMKRRLWLNSCRDSDNRHMAQSAASENGSASAQNNEQSNWNRARTQSMGSSYSYGRAFVAPTASACLREVGRHHSVNNNINQRFGNTDDMRNLLEDIYDI